MSDLLPSGAILLLLGSLIASLRQLPGMVWQQVRSRLILTVTVTKGDVFYDWLEAWLSAQSYSQSCRRLAVSCSRGGNKAEPEHTEHGGRRPWKLLLTPAPGDHFFKYQGRPVWMRRDRERLKLEGSFVGLFEEVTLTFLTRDRSVIGDFLDEVRRHNVPPDDDRLASTSPTGQPGSCWR